MADSALSSIIALLSAFSGGTTTQTNNGSTTTDSGGTTTKQTVMSQDTINGMLKSALESNQGLASVVSGEKSAGLYNSSTNTMLTNDLLSRLTTQVAAQAAPTVTTTTPVTRTVSPSTTVTETPAKVSPVMGASAAGGLGLLSLAKTPIDQFMKKLGKGSVDESTSGDISSAISGGIVDSGNTGIDFVNTTTLAGIDSASDGITDTVSDAVASTGNNESALSAFTDALNDSDSFSGASDWLTENYADVADNVAETIADNSDSGGSIWDSFKEWFA